MASSHKLAGASTENIELAHGNPLQASSSTVQSARTSLGELDDVSSIKTQAASMSASQQYPEELVATLDALPDTPNTSFLAPVDHGFGAWSFLAAAFFVEAMVWGFPHSFGVFLEAYLQDPNYGSQPNASVILPLIGPLSSGIMYFSGVIIQPPLARFPHHRRTAIVGGALICFASLFGASYASRITTLVILQGVLYAIGGSMLYAPCISYMSEWFVKRRGLANGVIFSGAAVGGTIFPIVISHLLKTHTVSKTLQILAIVIGSILVPFLPFIKGRLPAIRVVGPGTRADRSSWMKDRLFWIAISANTLQAFGHFVPMLWLPTFATDLNVSATKASIVLSLLNGAMCIGQTAMGILSDSFDPWMLALSSLVVTSFAAFVLWGVLSYTYAGLLVFGLTYGVLAGGWSSLWTGFVRPVAKDDHLLTTSLLSYLLCSRGIGNIVSTQISTRLVSGNATTHSGDPSQSGYPHAIRLGFEVGEGRFQNVILYVGSCFAGAAIIAVVGWSMEKWRAGRESHGGNNR